MPIIYPVQIAYWFHSPCSDEGPEDIYDDSIALVDEMTVSDLYEELVSETWKVLIIP